MAAMYDILHKNEWVGIPQESYIKENSECFFDVFCLSKAFECYHHVWMVNSIKAPYEQI